MFPGRVDSEFTATYLKPVRITVWNWDINEVSMLDVRSRATRTMLIKKM